MATAFFLEPALSGIYAAIWTPTDAKGMPIESALKLHLQLLQGAGVIGVLALGSTGNFARMEVAARKQTLETIIKHRGTLKVLANISDLRTDAILALGQHARDSGAVGVSIMPPWFYPSVDQDLSEFFVRIGERLQQPIILYNFPELTGKRLTPSVIDGVASRVPVAGLKQSGDMFERHVEVIACARSHGFPVLTGWDSRVGEALQLGATGCIGGLTNIVPELLVAVDRAYRAGDVSTAAEASRRLLELGQVCSALPFPINMAAGMEARGLEIGVTKADYSKSTEVAYHQLVHRMRELFTQWDLI